MTDILVGVVAGAKLGIFTLLLAYVILLARSTDLNGWLALLAGAFLVMVLGELVYVAGLDGFASGSWLSDFQNLQFFVDVLELVAIVGAVLFLRSFRRRLEG